MEQVRAQPNTRNTSIKRSSRRSFSRSLVEIGRYSVLTFFLLIFLLPFIWFLFMALKTDAELAANPFNFPREPQWGNFAKAWAQGHYSDYMLNTVIYTLSIVTGVAFFSCMGGYALAKLRFPGRDGIFIMILVGLMVPFLSLMIPMYYLVRDLNLLGTRLGLILPVTAMALPFGTFLMRAFFRGLPDELGDAGRIDGCNEWKVFRYIMLPLAWPGLTTLVVFEFMWSWNLFLQPLVLLQRDELRPVALALLFFTGRFSRDRGLVAAGIMLTILPVIIVYLILQRKFIEGITAGAVK
jgi:raffinose/stachyose/melibiose transport system permease protein